MEVVYMIINKSNGKKYIGSTVDYKKRVRSHLNGLRGGYHENEKLQKDFDVYGEESFEFEIVHHVTDGNSDKRFRLEEELIKFYKSYESGYNRSYDGRGRYIITDQIRKRMSERTSGENNPFYGKTHTAETRKRMSKLASKRTGNKNPFFNKRHTEETKERISEVMKAKYESGWNPSKGVPKTEEHIRKNMLGQPARRSVHAEGKDYPSISLCAKELGISRTTVRNRIKNEKFPDYYFTDDR